MVGMKGWLQVELKEFLGLRTPNLGNDQLRHPGLRFSVVISQVHHASPKPSIEGL